MPVHLPPISRRCFLAGSLLAGTALMFPRPLWAVEKPVDAHCWALFSDPHIAADPKAIMHDVNMTENFQAVSREVLGLPQRPAGVLVNGDCAFNNGKPDDYAALAALLHLLREAGMPVHLTLGNHDDRNHFWNAFAPERDLPRPVADHQVALVATPRANWFILDSLIKTLTTPGLLGEEQLAWLARALDANPGKHALVMVHHQPMPAGSNGSGLNDTQQLLEIIRPRKQVKAYFFGHTHKWSVSRDESGIHLINLPPVAYVFEPGQPSGWVRADLSPHGARLELRCLDHAHKAHGQVVDLKWRAA